MTVDEVAELVGRELFERTCATAWATAARAGRSGGTPWPDDESQVPHEVSDVLDGDPALGFALYRAMPCYAVLMYVGFEPHDVAFWTAVRSLLDDPDDRLAAPMAYWLWCGPFEGPEVRDAWRQVVEGAPRLRLRRVLSVSGPVPWELKAPLLERLCEQSEWRGPVLDALEGAAFDVLGSVEVGAALALLERLPGARAAALVERLRSR